MHVHQAVYGDKKRSHGLLAASGGDLALLKELEHRTDLPTSAPANIYWEPYLSGYGIGDWWMLSRTWPDQSASRGMVRTHLLILETDDLRHLDNLQVLLNHLAIAPNIESGLPLIEIDPSSLRMPVTVAPAPGMERLVHELLSDESRSAPVVWLGQMGFEAALTTLWRALWSNARRSLTFRLSFRPDDLGSPFPTIVVVPDRAELWWRNHRVVRSTDVHLPATRAEDLLLGRPKGAALRELVEEIGAQLSDIRDLKTLERAFERIEALNESGVEEIRALGHLVAQLSPDPSAGVALKQRIIKKLADLTAGGRALDIAALRNFNFQPFAKGQEAIDEAVNIWTLGALGLGAVKRSQADAEVIAQAYDQRVEGWSVAVSSSVAKAIDAWPKRASATLWAWWDTSPSLVDPLGSLLPVYSAVEQDLAKSCPHRVRKETGESVAKLSVKRRWPRLHAAAVGSSLPPQDAVDRQLKIEPKPSDLGIRLLADRIGPKETVAAAIRTADDRLVVIAGEVIVARPTLRADLDLAEEPSRAVWQSSLRDGADPWAGIPKPVATLHQLLDQVLEGKNIGDGLLLPLADSALGDLLDYPRREALWPLLGPLSKHAFLDATAESWLLRFATENQHGLPEPLLRSAILERSRIARHLHSTQFGTARPGLAIFTALPELQEDQFNEWLEGGFTNQGAAIPYHDAVSVGQFVRGKQWKRSAVRLANIARRRSDLIPALSAAADLLGLWDRFSLFVAGMSPGSGIERHERWGALLEVAIDLYPKGPDQRGIWERAGGDSADLHSGRTGRHQWQEAVSSIQNGGRPSFSRLLAAMSEDFPGNDRIQMLRNVYERLAHSG